MEQGNYPIQWTEDQWNLVQQTVREEARKVRVAASFLPIHGPLSSETEAVPLQTLNNNDPLTRQSRGEPANRLFVDSRSTRPLTTIAVNVYLTTAQASDQNLLAALGMFQRAGLIIARIQDQMVFRGQKTTIRPAQFRPMPPVFTITGGERWNGLAEAVRRITPPHVTPITGSRSDKTGNWLVRQVSNMITNLERDGYLAPFALVLGPDLFDLAHSPTDSLVMPADRIKPLLNGPLLRSSTLLDMEAIMVSLAADNVDLVLANDISVKFLQATMETRHVYRVSQRFTLRIKQPQALWALQSTL